MGGRSPTFRVRTPTHSHVRGRPCWDLTTGATLNAATLTNGTTGNGTVNLGMLLSRDGRVTAFDNNSTNLVAGTSHERPFAPTAGCCPDMAAGRRANVRLTRDLPDIWPDKRSLSCLRSAPKVGQSRLPC